MSDAHHDHATTFGPDPDRLWTMRLTPGERHALRRAFEADVELRGELEAYLRGLDGPLSDTFALAFARQLIADPDANALGAIPVALSETAPTGACWKSGLTEVGSWEQRFDLVEAMLGARLEAADLPPADVDWAWRRLVASRGDLRIAELAAELGCSRKHLAARFREHVGLPPKLFARVLRFRHASDLLSAPGTSLAQLAAVCGYYDQAHLDRDFRDFTGTTPTAYADERVTFVQDASTPGS